MKTLFHSFLLLGLLLLTECQRRSRCPAYQEIGTVGIPDENYEPTNYVLVQRNKKTGLIKKVGKVRKVQYTSRSEKSKLFKKDKKFLKDEELFPEVKNKKRPKKSKKVLGEEEEIEENNSPTPKDSL